MTYEQIVVEIADGIAILRLNRPDRMNALTSVMEAELRAAMEACDKDNRIRVIILTGEGRAFCAGMDMDELEALAPDDIRAAKWMRPYTMERRADYQSRYGYFPSISKPVIAAVNGAAAGLGLIFALYCDIRFASDKAVFVTAFSRRGLIAEHGIAWILPRIVGPAHAADLLYSSRKIDAAEAMAMGLVNRVVPATTLMDEALAYAREMASLVSPRSVGVMKRQMAESPFQTLAEATQFANEEMEKSFKSDDFKEGVSHFVEKRTPHFTGR